MFIVAVIHLYTILLSEGHVMGRTIWIGGAAKTKIACLVFLQNI